VQRAVDGAALLHGGAGDVQGGEVDHEVVLPVGGAVQTRARARGAGVVSR
jgi:hypothetical protein